MQQNHVLFLYQSFSYHHLGLKFRIYFSYARAWYSIIRLIAIELIAPNNIWGRPTFVKMFITWCLPKNLSFLKVKYYSYYNVAFECLSYDIALFTKLILFGNLNRLSVCLREIFYVRLYCEYNHLDQNHKVLYFICIYSYPEYSHLDRSNVLI